MPNPLIEQITAERDAAIASLNETRARLNEQISKITRYNVALAPLIKKLELHHNVRAAAADLEPLDALQVIAARSGDFKAVSIVDLAPEPTPEEAARAAKTILPRAY